MCTLLALPGDRHDQEMAHNIASLPMRMGGLGLRRALRIAPGACWASWADSPTEWSKIFLIVRTRMSRRIAWSGNSVGQARFCWQAQVAQPEDGRPTSGNFSSRARRVASRLTIPRFFIFRTHFPEERGVGPICAADQAHLCSHSGPGASDALSVCPSKQEYRIEAGLFRTLILERLRLPLQVTEKVCECGTMLDNTMEPRSGRLKKRALAPERTLARVCRELEQQYGAMRSSAT